MSRKWAKVTAVCTRVFFAHTSEHEKVVLPRRCESISDAQIGDIIEFTPAEPNAQMLIPPRGKPDTKPPKWFGREPIIIGYSVDEKENKVRYARESIESEDRKRQQRLAVCANQQNTHGVKRNVGSLQQTGSGTPVLASASAWLASTEKPKPVDAAIEGI